MQEIRIVDVVFYVIPFILAYLIKYLGKVKENVFPQPLPQADLVE